MKGKACAWVGCRRRAAIGYRYCSRHGATVKQLIRADYAGLEQVVQPVPPGEDRLHRGLEALEVEDGVRG